MKTLLLLRHAKSDWAEEGIPDHDRPLNKRGKKDAPKVGRLLLDENLTPDFILSSTAKRARRTAEKVCEACDYRGETHLLFDLYLASPETLQRIVAASPDDFDRILLVGHNPGLEEWLELLTGSYYPMATATLAWLEFPFQQWRELTDGAQGNLARLWLPQEIA